jgi:hypothetical protein
VLDDATLDILPKGVTMSIVRFLRFPELAKSPMGIEDISLDVAKQAAMQLTYVSAMYAAEQLLLPMIPYPMPAWLGARTLLIISFGVVALRGIFRRKAVVKAAVPAEGNQPAVEDEPASAEELDQICKVGGGHQRCWRQELVSLAFDNVAEIDLFFSPNRPAFLLVRK